MSSLILLQQDLTDKSHDEIKEIWRIAEEETDPKVLYHNSREAEQKYHEMHTEEHNAELKQ